MIKRLFSAFVFFTLTQTAFALPTLAPTNCPTVSDLATGNWDMIEPGSGDKNVFWGFKINQKLNTDVTWDAMFGPVTADTQDEAKPILAEKIPSLELMQGPYSNDDDTHYGCGYINSSFDFVAILVTPSSGNSSFKKALSHFSLRK